MSTQRKKTGARKNLTTWKEVWNRKARMYPYSLQLERLIRIDGFDTAIGKFDVNTWLAFVQSIKNKIGLRSGEKLLEVGCGAGAFVLPFYERGILVDGVDYSEGLINICRNVMPTGNFLVAEAKNLPFRDTSFHAIVCNSVFQYFENLAYAEQAIREIARVLKPGGTSAILDVNDAERRVFAEDIRVQQFGKELYEKLYVSTGLQHLFYSKSWLIQIAHRLELHTEIVDQDIPGYKNSTYRFTIFLHKQGVK